MANETEETQEFLKNKINSLEEAKKGLIEEIKKVNARLRYKRYESKKVLAKLEKTKKVKSSPLFKQLRILHFKVSTQAFTPAKEKLLVKKIEEIEKQLPQALKYEKIKRKSVLVEGDIKEAENRIIEIDEELKKMRDNLKEFYTKLNNVQYGSTSSFSTQTDSIAKKRKRKPQKKRIRDKFGFSEEDEEFDKDELKGYVSNDLDNFVNLEDVVEFEKE